MTFIRKTRAYNVDEIDTCVQPPPLGPQNSGRCWQVVIVQGPQNGVLCWQVVAIRRWLLAQVWVLFVLEDLLQINKNSHFFLHLAAFITTNAFPATHSVRSKQPTISSSHFVNKRNRQQTKSLNLTLAGPPLFPFDTGCKEDTHVHKMLICNEPKDFYKLVSEAFTDLHPCISIAMASLLF